MHVFTPSCDRLVCSVQFCKCAIPKINRAVVSVILCVTNYYKILCVWVIWSMSLTSLPLFMWMCVCVIPVSTCKHFDGWFAIVLVDEQWWMWNWRWFSNIHCYCILFTMTLMGDDGEPEVLGHTGAVRAVVFKHNTCVIIILCKKTWAQTWVCVLGTSCECFWAAWLQSYPSCCSPHGSAIERTRLSCNLWANQYFYHVGPRLWTSPFYPETLIR